MRASPAAMSSGILAFIGQFPTCVCLTGFLPEHTVHDCKNNRTEEETEELTVS